MSLGKSTYKPVYHELPLLAAALVFSLIIGIFGLSGQVSAQTFQSQGPSPITGDMYGENKPESGAIQAIAPDLTDASTIYIGAVNGGIWKTSDGGTTWKSLTDSQSSLAMGAMTLDLAEFHRVQQFLWPPLSG